MYYNAKGTYFLKVQIDKAGSKGKENVTGHVSCVRIQSEWKVTYLLNKSNAQDHRMCQEEENKFHVTIHVSCVRTPCK